jgi:uncharacterized membrane protein YgcG
MNRITPIGLALAVLTWAGTGHAQTSEAGVRDGAGMFSAEATSKANQALRDLRRDTHWQVIVETVATLSGTPIRDRALQNARAANVHGLYILIAKDDHKVWVEPSQLAERAFSRSKIRAITGAIVADFKAGRFDQGLLDALAEIRKDAEATPGSTVTVAASSIRDGADLFSGEAIRQADRVLESVRREHGWRVVIETMDSLRGQDIRKRAVDAAKQAKVHGLYILIAKDDRKVWVEPSTTAEAAFPKAKVDAIIAAFGDAFRAKEFDRGLADAVGRIQTAADGADGGEAASNRPTGAPRRGGPVAAAPVGGGGRRRPRAEAEPASGPPPMAVPPPPPAPKVEKAGSRLPIILALVAAGVLLLWVLSKVFSRPQGAPGVAYTPAGQPANALGAQPTFTPTGPSGPQGGRPAGPGYGPAPAPGYGPGYPAAGYGPPPAQGGGGGFVSGMLGGLGGAVLGNVLYDKFGRPHEAPGPVHGEHNPPVGHEAGAFPDAGYAPPPPAEPTRETYDPNAGAGGDWGGEPEQAASSGAGGDWGGAEDAGQGAAWGSEEAAGGGDWGSGDPGSGGAEEAGGDWGGGEADAGGGGDWGGDAGGGGDWGGDAGGGDAGGDDQGAGGSW